MHGTGKKGQRGPLGSTGRYVSICKATYANLKDLILKKEDEEPDGSERDEFDDEPINPLVDALFDEIEDLRMRVRCIPKNVRSGSNAIFVAL